MRSYGQFCGVARSLDVIGDRWSLLIVRELLIRPSRFTDLLNGLPGIARNLLADRLRALQTAEVIAREDNHYVLTDRGRALQPVLRELLRWSLPLMLSGQGDDVARGHWSGMAVETLFHGADLADLTGLVIGVDAQGEAATLAVQPPGELRASPGPPDAPEVSLRGSFEGVIAALTGLPTDRPAEISGDRDRLAALSERFDLD